MHPETQFLINATAQWQNSDSKLVVSRLPNSIRFDLVVSWAKLRVEEMSEVLCFVDPLALAGAQIKSVFDGDHDDHNQLVRNALERDMQDWIDSNEEEILNAVERDSMGDVA